jgi:hypothetical protein
MGVVFKMLNEKVNEEPPRLHHTMDPLLLAFSKAGQEEKFVLTILFCGRIF